MSLGSWILLLCILLLGACFFVVFAFWWIRRRLIRLGAEFVDALLDHIATRVQSMPKHEQIIEYDKILDRILRELGYSGTFAQKLQQYQKKNNIPQEVWNAHRERNNLVHEVGYQLPHKEIDRHVVALEKAVTNILKRGY